MKQEKEYVNAVIDRLGKGTKQNKREIDKIALQYGISDPTQVKELTELAIVLKAREIAQSKQSIKERYNQICELYRNQVNLSHRTSQSIMFQQYSTPAPIAFLASIYVLKNPVLKLHDIVNRGLGRIKKGGAFSTNHFKYKSEYKPTEELSNKPLFFEPSAGNGLLTIALPAELTVVNEVDETRYNNLCKQPYHTLLKQDATEPFYHYTKYFEGIVTNPPFGSLHQTVMYGDYPIKNLDHLMALRALDTMKDYGRAAIIIGGHTAWDAEGRIQQGKNRIFLSYLHKHYHVYDVININGELYSRQGTSFDVRLILINGRKSEPEGHAPLYSLFDKTVNDFSELYDRVNLKEDSYVNLSILERQAKEKIKQLQALELNGLEGPYRPASDPPLKALDTVVPDSMDYEVNSALVEIKDEVGGSINAYVRGHLGYRDDHEMARALSAEQVDAVAMAIYNIEEKRQALIVGDQTGIGKGRVAAAIIRYACRQGLKPIFLTEKANLFSDMYRDLSAIGSAHLRPFIVNANESKTKVKDEDGNVVYEPLERSQQERIFKSGHLSDEFDYIMLTYTQIASNKPTDKQAFIKTLANNNILILDESHNAGGDISVSATAKYFYDIVETTKGVLFLSATFAKRPDNMPIYALKTCLSDASLSKESLVEAIINGGVALQEVISANLVSEGQMLRRERSFEGIEVNYITLDREGEAKYGVKNKEKEHRAIVDNITTVLRGIIHFQAKEIIPVINDLDKVAKMTMTETEMRQGTQELGVSASPYFSKVFNVINQMLFSVKADEVAERAIQRLKEGKAPVIAFSSTMGAFLEDMQDERGIAIQDGTVINADFAEVLKRGLDGVLRYTEVEETGKRIHKILSPSELTHEAREEYYRLSEIIKRIATGISISPIDRIKYKIKQAGYSVAEVTGRKFEIQFKSLDSNVGTVATRKKELVNDAFRHFNNNEVDCLLINQSGSTGASAHAIVTSKVPLSKVRQRVMIVLQAELDINREVQKRGRINRTGQVYKPIYDYINSAIPAEKRLSMMLQKKLKSLDANTTSNQRNSKALLQSDDFLNKYGDKLIVDYLVENPEINDEIGDPLGLNEKEEESRKSKENAASKVSGRVAVLTTNEQQRFYDDMVERYRKQVNYLLQTGLYDLEVEKMDLQAKTIDKKIEYVGKGGSKSFGGHTYLEKCEVNVLIKPYTKTELDNLIKEALENKTAEQHKDQLMSALSEYSEVRRKKEHAQIDTKATKAVENITNEKKYQVQKTEQQRELYYKERLKEIESAKILSIENADKKIDNNKSYIETFFKFFKIGEAYYFVYNVFNNILSHCVFLGFDLQFNRANPFAPSAINARVAIANSSKYFDLALSGEQGELLRSIIAHSHDMKLSDKENIINNWDNLTKEASSDRIIRYIYTGNLLQAFGSSQSKGKLISFTTIEGATKKGILLSASFKIDDNLQNKTTVPLNKAIPIIESMGNSQRIETDNGVVIIRTNKSFSIATTSLSVQRFDWLLKEPEILQYLISREGFKKVSKNWVGEVYRENLRELLTLIHALSNCTVQLYPEQLELIKDDLYKETDTEIPVFPKLLELEVKLFAMLKGYEALNGLGTTGVDSSLSTLKRYYPFSVTSERSKIISDMVGEVKHRTDNFTDSSTISYKKIEVRYLLEKENVKPSEWIEFKHTFKRSEADVVHWLANEVRQLCQSQTSVSNDRLKFIEAEAKAKILILKLLKI